MRLFRSFTVVTAVLVCGLVAAGARATAKTQDPPAAGRQGGPPTNLKVLPKDTTRQAIVPIMRGFAGALGKQCNHCHVEDAAARASDDNPKKDIARKMIKMTMELNEMLKDVGTPATPDTPKVTCYTCHRGAVKPLIAAGGGH